MTFERGENLYQYDIYPKVVVAGKKTVIHVRPLGARQLFVPGKRYIARFLGHAGGELQHYPASADITEVEVTCLEDGSLSIPHTLNREQEYTLRMLDPYNIEQPKMLRFRIYCLSGDLVGKYPLMGDLHTHTTFSDGCEAPEVVCANYRAHGYDFIAITDHRRYYPSLRAIQFYKNVPTGLTIVPGEEVHMTAKAGKINPHIVNFGGEYSISAMVAGEATDEVGTDWETRSLSPDCPEVITKEQFSDLCDCLIANANVPEDVDALQAEGVKWICNNIRKANGLAIYAHPNWIAEDVYHVPDALHNYFVENQVFDAFEVLGGDKYCYLEQQGFQTVRYYKDMARGFRYPVVGSTDSHSSYPNNPIAYASATILFSEQNERRALIDAVKAFRSVAIDILDNTGDHYRLVGDERLVRYGTFLLRNYFPIHDEFCQLEGHLMRRIAVGTPDERQNALHILTIMDNYVVRNCKKYFDF
jgi:hypothetical protein